MKWWDREKLTLELLKMFQTEAEDQFDPLDPLPPDFLDGFLAGDLKLRVYELIGKYIK